MKEYAESMVGRIMTMEPSRGHANILGLTLQ